MTPLARIRIVGVLASLLGIGSIIVPALGATPEKIGPATADWIRAGINTNRPLWGVRGGLLWGLPAGRNPSDGPRGLIRLWSPVLTNVGYDLINFIAIEPIVRGRRGFSELERSALDTAPGLRLRATPHEPQPLLSPSLSSTQVEERVPGRAGEEVPSDSGVQSAKPDSENSNPATTSDSAPNLHPGQLTRLASGAQKLSIQVGVERFDNGAEVSLTVSQRSDAPDEIELVIHASPGSAPLDYCILTATMGNKARARQLWLKDEVASSLRLYPDYRGPDFAPHRIFALDRLQRSANGDVLAAITTDEANPSAVEPFPGRKHWRYDGAPVTQYWKKPAGSWRDDLHVAVNGRYTYWLSRQPIPGGIAFENFEMRERFHDGQRFVFGITRRIPGELGFSARR